MNNTVVYLIAWVFFPLILVFLLLGYRYFRYKENRLSIERGVEHIRYKEINRTSLIIYAAGFVSVGIGLVIGLLVIKNLNVDSDVISISIMIASILICLGFALLWCYFIIKKASLNQK